MKNNWFATLLIPLAFLIPTSGFAVTLDPGTVGSFFTWTTAGTVDSLDSNAFQIYFSDSKYITITPYKADAGFSFGIDFNSTGLESAPFAGYLTDSLGNEIAGTSFTGIALSAGFVGGSLVLNEVVVSYGVHITFTEAPPATPFSVKFGSGVSSNVNEHRPVIGQGDGPEPPPPEIITLDVPLGGAPTIDGDLSWQEWDSAARLTIDNGFIAFTHDQDRLYVLIDMLNDTGDDSFNAGGGDQFWLYFDVDRDGVITPDIDIRYRLESGTGNLRFQTFCEDCLFGFNPLVTQTYSSRGEGFGCYRADQTASFFPLSCDSHRIWELGIDLHEIGLNDDEDIRMGYLVSSGSPAFTEAYPTDLNSPQHYMQLTLEGRAREISNLNAAAGGAQFEVTQAIQTPQNELDLVAGKPTAVRVWAESSTINLFKNFIYGGRGGVDLPGSPLLLVSTHTDNLNPDQSRHSADRLITLPTSWIGVGKTDFALIALGPNDDIDKSLMVSMDFVPTRKPVFWTLPVRNTLTNGTVRQPTTDWMMQVEQAVQTIAPVEEVNIVRRPVHDVENLTSSEQWTQEMQAYDQATALAWVMGLLIGGESPFDFPEQIAGLNFESLGGLSDPVWFNGNGRVTWSGPGATSRNLVVAHEINHNLDIDPSGTWGHHSWGCGAENRGPDPAWPYGTDTNIQEVGVMWTGSQFISVPDTTPDLMSYCQGITPIKWMSPYRWQAWLDLFRIETGSASALSSGTEASFLNVTASAVGSPVDSFYVLGRVYQQGGGELGQILRQPGLPDLMQDKTGEYLVQVLDCEGNSLVEKRFGASFIDSEGNQLEFVSFDLIMAAPADACSIELSRGDSGEVWAGDETVSWTASDEDGDDLLFTLLYSPDGGMTWQPLVTRLTGNQHTLDSTQLPGSDDARIRILATDGANTSQDDSDAAFTVVDKPPRVSIVAPVDGALLDVGNPVLLAGLARDTLGNRLGDDQLLWFVDGQPIGMGANQQAFGRAGPGCQRDSQRYPVRRQWHR
jgi:hypothetical protein